MLALQIDVKLPPINVTVDITHQPEGAAPAIRGYGSQQLDFPDNTIVLFNVSTDFSGTIEFYTFRFDDGLIITNQQVQIRFLKQCHLLSI